jgi:hypothetical protein
MGLKGANDCLPCILKGLDVMRADGGMGVCNNQDWGKDRGCDGLQGGKWDAMLASAWYGELS